jgi:enamine deaminase RidA (YjgF/YER057c/UK114 family)
MLSWNSEAAAVEYPVNKVQGSWTKELEASVSKTAIFPPGSRDQAMQVKVSPGIVSGDHVFLTGITGSHPDGSVPENAEDQIRCAFDKIGSVLAETGLSHEAIVEMTSYHVGIHDHFDVFNDIRCEYVSDPYPAWTAIEVAGLRRAGAIVEIRVIARLSP